ncbi:MAG: amino acid ABC transporter permease [Oscillospiraceae bacterium]|jgi:L-cystine transport system permease protein|nr:amino acid ABC transporter permease [Oscillospiraceae bacterium]
MQYKNYSSILDNIKELLPYLSLTFQYVLLALLFGFIFALLLAVMKLCKYKVLRAIAQIYTTIMRCLPSVVLLFVVYFFLPKFSREVLLIDIDDVPKILFVVLTFALFLGGFLSEVMRSAYQAVSKDQMDAALSIGLTPLQAFIRIILPQAFYYAIPNLANTVIYLLKEGALAYTIGLIDVMGRAYQMNTLSYSVYPIPIFVALALIYWPLAIVIEQLFKILERLMNPIKEDKKTAGQKLKGFKAKYLGFLVQTPKGGAEK